MLRGLERVNRYYDAFALFDEREYQIEEHTISMDNAADSGVTQPQENLAISHGSINYASLPADSTDPEIGTLDADLCKPQEEQIQNERSRIEVTESKATSGRIPDDSGYASQSRPDNSFSTSEQDFTVSFREPIASEAWDAQVPDGLQNASQSRQNRSVVASEHVQADEDDETNDDIASIFSDTADIQSRVSIDTNLPAQEGKLHLAQMLATDGDLAPLCRKALCRMDRGRFVNTIRKLLKPYYRNLLREAKDERQRRSVELLKSRHGRHRIGLAMARLLDTDLGGEEEEERREELLEQVQRRAIYLNDWIAQFPHSSSQVLYEPFSEETTNSPTVQVPSTSWPQDLHVLKSEHSTDFETLDARLEERFSDGDTESSSADSDDSTLR